RMGHRIPSSQVAWRPHPSVALAAGIWQTGGFRGHWGMSKIGMPHLMPPKNSFIFRSDSKIRGIGALGINLYLLIKRIDIYAVNGVFYLLIYIYTPPKLKPQCP